MTTATTAPAALSPDRVSTRTGVRAGETTVWGAVAAVVAFAWSWVPSLWTDEGVTQQVASRDWAQLPLLLDHRDAVHGLYYALMSVWTSVAGTEPWALRLPSALAAGVAVAGVLVLGSRLGGVTTGRAAAAVAVTMPAVTWMGSEARSFAFVAAVTVWSFVALARAVERGRGAWVLYAVAVVAGGLLFVQSLLVVAAQGVTMLLVWRHRFVPWLVTAAAAAAVLAPFAWFALAQRDQVAWLPPVGGQTVSDVLFEQWFDGGRRYGVAVLLLATVAVVVAVVRVRAGRAGAREVIAVALPWLVVPTLVVLAVSVAFAPMYQARYLAYTAPGVALLVGWGLAQARWSVARWAVVLLLVVLAVPTYLFQRTETAKDNSDWAQAAAALDARAGVRDVVLFAPDDGDERAPRRVLDTYPSAFTGLADPGRATDAATLGRFWDEGRPAVDVLTDARVDEAWLLGTHVDGLGPALEDQVAAIEDGGYTVREVWRGPSSVLFEVTR